MRNKIPYKFYFWLVFMAPLLSGCETMSYYSQSIVGHSRLMLARQPIEQAISVADEKQAEILQTAISLREFAIEELGLPRNDSYLSFVDLKRKYPVWAVVAAEEFSIYPVTWCFPIAGCTSYRGYFSKKSALKYEQKLRSKGLETIVGGAPAYSTLGWFNDPLIPSMYVHGEIGLAEIMFHELAHQQFYIKGNSAFNEAFATAVGEQGTLIWLRQFHPEKVDAYQQLLSVRSDFSELVRDSKAKLQQLYSSSLNADLMRQEKQLIFDEMFENFQQLKLLRWNGKNWYGTWFESSVNNAKLAAFSTYRDMIPKFEQLLKACDNDFELFYGIVKTQQHSAEKAEIPKSCIP